MEFYELSLCDFVEFEIEGNVIVGFGFRMLDFGFYLLLILLILVCVIVEFGFYY